MDVICEAGTIDSWAGQLEARTASVIQHHWPPVILSYAGTHPLAIPLATATCGMASCSQAMMYALLLQMLANVLLEPHDAAMLALELQLVSLPALL